MWGTRVKERRLTLPFLYIVSVGDKCRYIFYFFVVFRLEKVLYPFIESVNYVFSRYTVKYNIIYMYRSMA